jgi:hypothetical protein
MQAVYENRYGLCEWEGIATFEVTFHEARAICLVPFIFAGSEELRLRVVLLSPVRAASAFVVLPVLPRPALWSLAPAVVVAPTTLSGAAKVSLRLTDDIPLGTQAWCFFGADGLSIGTSAAEPSPELLRERQCVVPPVIFHIPFSGDEPGVRRLSITISLMGPEANSSHVPDGACIAAGQMHLTVLPRQLREASFSVAPTSLAVGAGERVVVKAIRKARVVAEVPVAGLVETVII